MSVSDSSSAIQEDQANLNPEVAGEQKTKAGRPGMLGAAEVLELTSRTRHLLPDVVLSVTVPHILPLLFLNILRIFY